MNYRELSEKLLSLLGGKENILGNAACMTRLRISVRDLSIVDIEAIKKVDGVLGVVESETLQIILGPGKVNKALEEFSRLTGLAKGAVSDAPPSAGGTVEDLAKENKAAQKAKYDKPLQNFLKKIANIIVALLPGIIAAG